MSSVVLIVKSLSAVNRSIFFQVESLYMGEVIGDLVRLKIGTGEPSLLANKINIKRLVEGRKGWVMVSR
jgi:hypothetical protein